MKNVAAVLLGVVVLNTSAFGGLILFEPTKANVPEGDGPIEFIVSINSDLDGGFDAIDLVIGSNDVPILGFTFDAGLALAVQQSQTGVGFWTHDVFVTTNDPGLHGPNLILGTVTVDPSGLGIGEYSIFVNGAEDGFSQALARGAGDPLNGTGLINVTPEPMTLSLLGLGALALLRRRRTA